MKTPILAALALATATLLPMQANAQDDWFVRVGPVMVNPKSGNGTLAGGALAVDIDSNTQLGLAFGRYLSPNLAVELLAATPFHHTVALNGADAVDFKHLPPTLSLQYYFAPDAGFNPFVGAGLNYTLTFSEDSYGPVAGNEVTIGNSWGLAAQVGAVIKIGETMDLVVDARWADIDADVQLNGAEIGTANVDPLVYGLTLGFRF
ncbi:MAG: Outer membrane protein W precursor [Alphaproteobacteria bacterium ADurb.BinA280]|jgi:outer membrane protein|nr:OmpW family protein [Xanthomonadales bacterium]MCC6505356.1 OmpW family protein [Aquimonas sp.]OPZ13630.1 MAG: Outer membrane protein W precursor [Alphaproteobacteria bacterium ADurb.BinA280]